MSKVESDFHELNERHQSLAESKKLTESAADRILARAERAEKEASRWHQGSGIHADMCLGWVEEHLMLAETDPQNSSKHIAAADAWATAAEEEAKYMKDIGGEWEEFPLWIKSRSGKAADKAVAASRRAGVRATYSNQHHALPSRG